jgi:hypothetical protein
MREGFALEHLVQSIQEDLCSMLAIFWPVFAVEKGPLLCVE